MRSIVSAPYELMRKAREQSGTAGWEVYRNPSAAELPAGEFLLVTSDYPLSMTRFRMPVAAERLESGGCRVARE